MKKKKLIDILFQTRQHRQLTIRFVELCKKKIGSDKSKYLKFLSKIDSNVNCFLKYFYEYLCECLINSRLVPSITNYIILSILLKWFKFMSYISETGDQISIKFIFKNTLIISIMYRLQKINMFKKRKLESQTF